MTIPPPRNTFVRVNPGGVIHNVTHTATLAVTTKPLADWQVKIPPLTAMIRIRGVINSTAGGAGSIVYFRDFPGGDDVASASCSALGVPGAWSGFLELNNGAVTFRADIGAATSFGLFIVVTGFLRYA